MTLFILFFIFLLIIFIFYFSTRFGGFNNIYIEQLFNHISLIPFSNVYALICNKNVITFVNNIIINSLLAFVISFYIIYFKKNNNKFMTILLILNLLLELFKWLMTIGIFDIDDIIIRCIVGLIVISIYKKKKEVKIQ